MRKGMLLCLICILLLPFAAACGSAANKEFMLSLKLHRMDEIKQLLSQKSISVKETEMMESYRLSGADESVAYRLDDEGRELLYIYVFGSPEEMSLGVRALEEQTALIDIVYLPYIYTANNALIIHMRSLAPGTDEVSDIEKLASELGWKRPEK
ncbi:hypothetical protein [Paenibacillus sp. NEAU-GSW1]|uniref:hypothetical protein n=1 Tax=Paenibacillus sp. NEAU-GSW1 TaxID=2682486 RepID=UPI0012E2B37C|nr:hypothetical protein [Paenibacillus sp. NEAU-GSW1]MUT65130.1 hypothetical protein [Paenibacillus sp. NEAU-GSW1]